MAKQQSDKEVRTSDIYYAAYLKVARVPYIRSDREGNRVIFVFEKTPMNEDLKRDYFNRVAKVPALDYADEVKNMKTLTHL